MLGFFFRVCVYIFYGRVCVLALHLEQILVLDVAEVVPEPGQPLLDRRLKLVFQKEYKQGPVTALSEMHGALAVSIGQEVYLMALEDNALNGIAFLHHQAYATSLCCFKSFMVIGDLVHSVSFVRLKVRASQRAMDVCKHARRGLC